MQLFMKRKVERWKLEILSKKREGKIRKKGAGDICVCCASVGESAFVNALATPTEALIRKRVGSSTLKGAVSLRLLRIENLIGLARLDVRRNY